VNQGQQGWRSLFRGSPYELPANLHIWPTPPTLLCGHVAAPARLIWIVRPQSEQ
jgi:hypothetical protein